MNFSLQSSKRIVVKIGSALLVNRENTLRKHWLQSVINDIASLRAEGKEVVIVSSGSMALGRAKLGLKQGRLNLSQKQAAAAVGQIELAQVYEELSHDANMVAAQVLLTLTDSEDRKRVEVSGHGIRQRISCNLSAGLYNHKTFVTARPFAEVKHH